MPDKHSDRFVGDGSEFAIGEEGDRVIENLDRFSEEMERRKKEHDEAEKPKESAKE